MLIQIFTTRTYHKLKFQVTFNSVWAGRVKKAYRTDTQIHRQTDRPFLILIVFGLPYFPTHHVSGWVARGEKQNTNHDNRCRGLHVYINREGIKNSLL